MSSLPADINKLNHDVIRTIIRVGLEHVDNMRQISPLWNVLAKEELNKRKNLPLINRFGINTSGYRELIMRIPNRYLKYFGVEDWDNEIRYKYSLCEYKFGLCSARDELSNLSNRFSRIFNRCSRIGCLEFQMNFHTDANVIEEFRRAIHDTDIYQFSFNIIDFESTKSHILKIIECCQVSRLQFVAMPLDNESIDTLLPIFLAFLGRVPTVELHSEACDDYDSFRARERRMQHQQQLKRQILQEQQKRHCVPPPSMQHFLHTQQQHQLPNPWIQNTNDRKRASWKQLTDNLSNTKKVTVNLHEDTDYSGTARFRLVLTAVDE